MKKALGLSLALLASPTFAQAGVAPEYQARIDRILAETPLIDGHNDLAEQITENYGGDPSKVDLMKDTRGLSHPLHTDIPRLREGRVGGQFWSVYVPADLEGAVSGEAVRVQMDIVRRFVADYPAVFEFADSADDIERIHKSGRIASMFGMEGGEAINGKLGVLREFRNSGVLYMTLCHWKTTSWVDSATDAPQHGGLSPLGEQIVAEMNRIGMLVDLSHTSALSMKDALRVSKAPVIFSHSSAMAIDGHPRNVPDDVLKLVRKNGGVVMVNFAPAFVSEELRQWSANKDAEEARQKALSLGDPAAAKAGLEAWVASNPAPQATLAQVADHIEHIRNVAGVDHVGIGSDFDGIPNGPAGLEGVETYPALFAELMRRGWSDADIAKLAGGNLLRALRQAEKVAANR
ncbi:MAG: membrane dipeptidase [Alphaproteobacteria bacterium RIFCSPHIGHO2_12_FULL_63_12]|nr:MAG: membrane dipeptidase [Alphaproteobacteria bacterium RIFCSPHIGHO2_12_FULL_63_12]